MTRAAVDGDAFDVVVVGAGSAGCALAGRLIELDPALTICVVEAGPGDETLLVSAPFGLVRMMGRSRDWRRRTTPQAALDGRSVKAPRGRMVGGSGSINSMVWFRGRADDFDGWAVDGWRWADVAPAFDAVEAAVSPKPFATPHPLSTAFAAALGAEPGSGPPTPERESAGVFTVNMRRGRRWSAADAFLRPALASRRLTVLTGVEVERLDVQDNRAVGVVLVDGRRVAARAGVALCAGALESPAVLMRSGLGPAGHLVERGVEPILDAPEIGGNLHDHPAVALHHAGPGSGYGLTPAQAPMWLAAPAAYAIARRGPFASNTVEAGAFLRAGAGDGPPDVQVHFIPFMLGWDGAAIVWGKAGYAADVCVSRPRSRGRLRLAGPTAAHGPEIDLGLLTDPQDAALLRAGVKRLRRLLSDAPFGRRRAPEAFPGPSVVDDAALDAFIRARAGTSYHPVGTVRLGGPITNDLRVRGLDGLWVADASILPAVTSANTNAPAMMIGWRGAEFVAQRIRARAAA